MNRKLVLAALGAVALGVALVAAVVLLRPERKRGRPPDPAGLPEPGLARNGEPIVPIEPVWRSDRKRRCGLVELGLNPASAGRVFTTLLEHRKHVGGAGSQWIFTDEAGALTLTGDAAACFSTVQYRGEPGYYRFRATLPDEPVAHDEAVDARSVDDEAWRACAAAEAEPPRQAVRVVTVLDTDGSVWTSDGTRDDHGLRHCLGEAHRSWVQARHDDGSLGLGPPAIVVGTLPGWQTPPSPG